MILVVTSLILVTPNSNNKNINYNNDKNSNNYKKKVRFNDYIVNKLLVFDIFKKDKIKTRIFV
jgi:hypothetical protein